MRGFSPTLMRWCRRVRPPVLGPGSGAFADYLAGVLVVPETL